jgi:amino acid adenylation domain-containing protein
MKEKNIETGLEIAIIGMAGRFPGAQHLEEFWENLKNGVESISFFTDEELKQCGISEEQLSEPLYVKAYGIIKNKEYFDSSFFGYTPKEAESMDPQVRLFHECAWQALEDAGCDPGSYSGSIGTYAGIADGFSWRALKALRTMGNGGAAMETHMLDTSLLLSEHISHKLDLKGPSMTVFTACSTALVAVHLACRALLTGECDMALAGAVSVIPVFKTGYLYQEGMILSPDGHCRPFDEKAGGTVFGEGMGIVVLKRLKDARADRDTIQAVIKGTAVNNDGVVKASFTSPGKKRIADVMRTVLKISRVEAGDISYIETHGTATSIGDTIEFEALKLALDSNKKGFCGIGSVKSNIGHLDVTAGMAGLIKTVLAFRHGFIPPSLNFETPNAKIDLINSPFYVNTWLTGWKNKDNECLLRAGVCSFGIGGTNAFILLEEAPTARVSPPSPSQDYQLILLSARTDTDLDNMTKNLAEYLKKNPGVNLADATYTLQVGRKAFNHRRMLVCSTIDEAIELLSTPDPKKVRTAVSKTAARSAGGSRELMAQLGRALQGNEPGVYDLLIKTGMMWLAGVKIDWHEFYAKYSSAKRSRIPLPTYPFAGQRYWIDAGPMEFGPGMLAGDSPLQKKSSPTLYPRPGLSTAFVAPGNEIEQALAGIWQGLFGIQAVGIHDDFYELGGDSLKAITAATEILQEMKTRVPIVEIFQLRTIEKLGKYIGGARQEESPAIEKIEKREYYSLSSVQRRLYVLHQLDTGSTGYNNSLLFVLKGNLDVQRLESAFRQLIRRHESLRTFFETLDEVPVQRIREEVAVKVQVEEKVAPFGGCGAPGLLATFGGWEGEPATRSSQPVTALISAFIRPFDLSQAPLLRVGLIHTSSSLPGRSSQEENCADEYILMIDMHHIITDGTSVSILVREFVAFYAGEGENLPGLRIQYKDYAQWQNSQQQREAMEKQEEYWLNKFHGEIPVLNLPVDFTRPTIQSFAGSRKNFTIGEKETRILKDLAVKEDATLFMVLLSLYDIMLAKICRQEDIVVGTPVACRRHADLQHIMGMLVNTLALRNYPAAHQTFIEFLRQVRDNTLAAFENQDYLFEDLVEKVAVQRDVSRNPIFDTMFAMQNFGARYGEDLQFEINGLSINFCEFENNISIFDLSLTVLELENALTFVFEYCTKLFQPGTIDRFIGFFKNIVSSIVESPAQRISHIPIISEADKNRVLYDFNDTETQYPQDKTTPALFKEQVEKTPDQMAVIGVTNLEFEIRTSRSEGTRGLAPLPVLMSITYKKLNESADQLAYLLKEKGVGLDTIVGIMVERSVEMIIGILGILKAGGAYLPLDPEYPEERIKYMLGDSKVSFLVINSNVFSKFSMMEGIDTIFIDDPVVLSSSNHLRLGPWVDAPAASLVYIIYTSGSTGRPKGVMLEHRNVVNLILYQYKYTPIDFSRVLQFTTISFDVSFQEIFSALLWGGALVLISNQARKHIPGLFRAIEENQIKTLFLPASFLKFIFNEAEYGSLFPGCVDHIVTAGEQVVVTDKFRDYLKTNSVYLHNHYGPSETHVVTALTMEPHSEIPVLPSIGKPLSNTRVYIVDKNFMLQPIGVAGELFIGGIQVGRGYLNRPELTAERFRRAVISHSSLVISSPSKLIPNDQCPMTNDRSNKFFPNDQCPMTNDRSNKFFPNDQCPMTNDRSHPHHSTTPPLTTHHLPIYQTGDLARWFVDGNIEFLGRIDTQVKIRGFRVELGDIESHLLSHKAIKDAVVIERRDLSGTGDQYLCAYIAAAGGIENVPDSTGLKEYLARRLPDYMVPSFFVPMERIPLTLNGKVDRKALPKPGVDAEESYIAPGNREEEGLAEIWSEVLGIEKSVIGIDSDFFQLGGHSLRATIMLGKIRKRFDVDFSLSEIFKTPSIRGICSQILLKKHVQQQGKYEPIIPVEKKEYYPVSSAQKRLYILYRVNKENTVYNMPSVLELENGEQWDKQSIEDTFRRLVYRHESFRTSFEIINEEPVQRIKEEVEFKVENKKVEAEVKVEQERSSRLEGTRGLAPLPVELAERKAQSAERKEERHAPCAVRCAGTIKNFIRPFDLSRAPLLRVGLIELPHTPAALRGLPSQKGKVSKFILMVDMHHIISDGMSIEILIKEFMALQQKNVRDTLPGLKLQYKDYSEWQRQRSEKEQVIEKQQLYWLKEFEGERSILNLPYDYPRPAVQSFAGETITFELQNQEVCALNHLVKKENVTLFMILLSVFNILLGKLSGQEDIVIGTPIAGRIHPDLDPVIGMFVNTLALRNYPHGETTFSGFLSEVKEKALKAFENQDYPFETLVEKVTTARDAGRNPLFDVMFALHNMRNDAGTQGRPGIYAYENKISRFDMLWMGTERDKRIDFEIEYCTKLFKRETIERFFAYFKKIVTAVTNEPGILISRIEIISTEERKQVLYDFNETATEYPGDKTIHALFEEQAERTPDNIAAAGPLEIKYRTNMTYMTYISYGELNEKANQLAHLLIEKGIGPDTIVGIMVERSIEMIVDILGILKAGGAYLPIDPGYPEERIKYMLEDSGAGVLITTSDLSAKHGKLKIVNGQLSIVNCQQQINRTSAVKKDHMHLQPAPATSLAYIIYTSGTTGKPKGVMATHTNVVRVVRNTNYIEINDTDRVLQLSNYAFDGSVFDIYGALLNGAVLLTMTDDEVKSSDRLSGLIKQQQVTVFFVTTALFNTLVDLEVDCLSNVRKVLFGGEQVSTEHSRKALTFLGKQRIIHVYGPTETTVYATYYFIDAIPETAVTIPIGAPISNTVVYIFDKCRNLVPIGVSGEIFIGGAGTARGYLNQPELTIEKFCLRRPGGRFLKKLPPWTPHKNFSLLPHHPIYRTGDLARWLPDGNMEFLGRIDSQVKIRGFRIETGEIERCLLDIDYIKETVVVAKDDNKGGKYLCAYVVSGQKVASDQLKNILAQILPDYMLPSYFIQIKQIPLTPNNKIDRKSLPEPQRDVGENYVAPGNKIQVKLTEIWSETLGIKKEIISIESNFFELGGHSLKATFLAAKIHKELHVKVPLAEIFKTPTIRGLSRYIQNTVIETHTIVQALEKKEYYTLSSPQRRLYVLQQMDAKNLAYNMPGVISLTKMPDIEKLEKAFIQLIERHDSLRTSFHLVEENPVQKIHDKVEFEIQYHEKKEADEDEQRTEDREQKTEDRPDAYLSSVIRHLSSEFIRPFDLTRAPLLRVGLLALPHTPAALRGHPRRGTYNSQEGIMSKYLLMVDMHHIISDGISHKILGQDIMALYRGEILPLLRLQYKDFAGWQTSESQKKALKQQEAFWLNVLAREIPLLNLPIDYPRPLVQSFAGDIVNFEISTDHTHALKNLALGSDATLYMLLLTIFNVLLSRLTGQEDIIIGTPVVNRRHSDLEQIIGMFVNTLALRNFPNGEKFFNQFLQEVKLRSLQAFENQEYPFENLVEKVDIKRDTSRNPLFDVLFSLQDFFENKEKINETVDTAQDSLPIDQNQHPYKNRTAQFDLVLVGVETDDKLVFGFQYCTKLLKKETIQRFAAYFKKIILSLVENPGMKLCRIEMLSEEEKEKLIYDFNETNAPYPHDKILHQLFIEQVSRTPDNVALVFQDKQVTYKELNRKSNQLARLLIEKGMKAENLVGILLDRSLEMIVCILSVLKSGAAYLPIDPQYPPERIRYILNDSNITVLLSRQQDLSPQPGYGGEVVLVEAEEIYRGDSRNLELANTPGHIAYVIYTSGSTGTPRGVIIQHFSVINLIFCQQRWFKITAEDRILQLSSISFDASVEQIFITLCSGALLALIDRETMLDGQKFAGFVSRHAITHIHAVPSFLNSLDIQMHKFYTLKKIVSGGDICPLSLAEKWYDKCNFHNEYGPTETTVTSLEYPVKNIENSRAQVPIGKPLDNTKVYVLDRYKKIIPQGAAGELYIGGDGLARGYLNNPELTEEKFLSVSAGFYKSYMSYRAYIPKKIYKTGDLVRWLPDGNLQFLGRIDYQVKIRGYRIEIGEIENCLLKYPGISETVVLVKEYETGDKYLCAYLVSGEEISPVEIREYLSKYLPDYMIPTYYMQIEEVPLNPNGKIDRDALPPPEIIAEGQYKAPRDEIETKLAAIWSEILGVEKDIISIDADFFRLGGHSLKANVLASRIRKEFNTAVPLIEVFKNPSIESLAQYINTTAETKGPGIELLGEDNLVIIRKGDPGAVHLFLVHAGSGEVEGYIDFCSHLSPEITCWGLRADRLENYAPRDITIEIIAQKYIEKIIQVQANGPYYIAGWCIGGTIAFEMVRQLEQMGKEIRFLGIINSHAPREKPGDIVNAFAIDSELEWLGDLSAAKGIKEKLKGLTDLKYFWPLVINHLERNHFDVEPLKRAIPGNIANAVPNFEQQGIRELVFYFNMNRSMGNARDRYIPGGKNRTRINFFGAREFEITNRDNWNIYSQKSFKFYEIEGDHFSIFKPPHVSVFAGVFNKALKF